MKFLHVCFGPKETETRTLFLKKSQIICLKFRSKWAHLCVNATTFLPCKKKRWEQKEMNIPARKAFHQVIFAGFDTSQSSFHFLLEVLWSKEEIK